MRFYKIINETNFIGVGDSDSLRKYQQKYNTLFICDEQEAQYIYWNEALYHDSWMYKPVTDAYDYTEAQVIEIDEQEYNTLYEAIETGEEIIIDEEPEPEIDEQHIDETEVVTVEYVRSAKIAEMSKTCEQAIIAGFDATLSDGQTHHFSLTLQDQLNLVTLQTQLASGETTIPYHADDELCRFFTPAEVQIIIEAATYHKTYHVTYFNMLKSYIEQLETIEEISAVTYGMELDDEFYSDVMRQLIHTGD